MNMNPGRAIEEKRTFFYTFWRLKKASLLYLGTYKLGYTWQPPWNKNTPWQPWFQLSTSNFSIQILRIFVLLLLQIFCSDSAATQCRFVSYHNGRLLFICSKLTVENCLTHCAHKAMKYDFWMIYIFF